MSLVDKACLDDVMYWLLWLTADVELSSISGSDSDSSSPTSDAGVDAANTERSAHCSQPYGRQRHRLLMTNSAGQMISLARCVVETYQVGGSGVPVTSADRNAL